MAEIKLANMIVPEIWEGYTQQAILAQNQFFKSGILATSEALTRLANGAGQTINMPYLGKLTGEAEGGGKGYDGEPLTKVGGIEVGKNIATKVYKAATFKETDWASLISGADPIGAITAQLGEFWAGQQQISLIDTISGALDKLSDDNNTTHTIDDSGKTDIEAKSVIKAKALLGTNGAELKTIAMHSAVYYNLVAKDLIIGAGQAGSASELGTYLGLNIIIDDGLVAKGEVYDTLLFGAGSIGYANITPPNAIEIERVADSGIDVLISRRGWILHPFGFSFTGSFNPENTELKDKTKWTRTLDHRAIRIARIKHKIAD